MRKLANKIDPLLLIFIVSTVLIFSFSTNVKNHILGNKSSLKKYEDLSHIVHLPDSSNNAIYLNDPRFNLYYSVNGGDTYLKDDQILPSTIFWANLSKYLISNRSKPISGVQPVLSSILVKSKHKTKDIYADPKMVTLNIQNTHELPIISIIASERALFSEMDGIMALGKDAWVNEGYYLPFWNQNANYKRRGVESKVKSYWQFIEDNKIQFETESDLQVSGNATRSFPQKSLKLKANRLYGNEVFRQKFFGKKGVKSYTSLVIRNSGNDNRKTLFADLLMHNLAKKSNVIVQAGKPIVLYINGNYWGIYNLRERIDLHMIAKKENAEIEDITILEGGAGLLKDGHTAELNSFQKIIEMLKSNNPTKTFDFVKQEVDLKSFVDYIILETFYGNGDWLHNNALWYKENGKKWKWILNDLDYGLSYQGANNMTRNYFSYLAKNNTVNAQLFNFLINNDEFKTQFKERASEMMAVMFTNKRIKKKVKHLYDKISPEMVNHTKRWTSVFTVLEWKENVQANEDFLINRKTVYLSQIAEL